MLEKVREMEWGNYTHNQIHYYTYHSHTCPLHTPKSLCNQYPHYSPGNNLPEKVKEMAELMEELKEEQTEVLKAEQKVVQRVG